MKYGNARNQSSSPFTGEVAAKRPEGVRLRAKQLRKEMTRHEVALWFQLKAINKEHGCHFRRQAPAGGYILDFVDFGRRLIIEVDGWQHGEARGAAHDRKRDAYLSVSGFRTLRFWNHEIDQSLGGVCDAIIAAVEESNARYSKAKALTPSGAARHLPRKGRG
jgi:very-short-patch-repair endonuclease